MATVSGFSTPPAGTPAVDLGSLIFLLNPYKAVWPPASAWLTPYPPAVVTIEAVPANQGMKYLLDASGIEHQEKPGEWKFKYSEKFINRAISVPYMYYKESPLDATQGVLVRDYLLIGFEGGVGY